MSISDSFFGRKTNTAVEPEIIDKLYNLLLNYDRLKYKSNKTKVLLQNIVKPDSIDSIRFVY